MNRRERTRAVLLEVLGEKLPGRNGFPKVQDNWLADDLVEALAVAGLIQDDEPDQIECDAELPSWPYFSDNAVDFYYMRCDLLGPHAEHENQETGAKWPNEDFAPSV